MRIVRIATQGVIVLISGILFALLPYSVDTKGTILTGIEEPTGNAYEDVFVAEV